MATANLGTFFLLLLALQACLWLYVGQDQTIMYNNSLWDFATNPQNWSNTTFILGFVGIASTLGIAGVIAGSVFGFKTDFIIFATAIAGFLSMGAVFASFANVMSSNLSALFCMDTTTGLVISPCAPVTWIIAITIAPIAFYFVWAVINWWRKGDQ